MLLFQRYKNWKQKQKAESRKQKAERRKEKWEEKGEGERREETIEEKGVITDPHHRLFMLWSQSRRGLDLGRYATLTYSALPYATV